MPTQQEILYEQLSRQEYEEDYGDVAFGSEPSPASPQPALSATNESSEHLTRVNGIGLWNSWTRNFSTPLLAMLDILDNAFDAGFANPNPHYAVGEGFQGRIHIAADEYQPSTNEPKKTTGICVINNSAHRIKPLSEVLEVYKSAKGSGADSIGENGVGLKQGCATLSDLSFVLTRNGSKCSLGVISFALQKPEGCFLPAFEFDHSDSEGRRQEMEFIFNVNARNVGESVRAYGEGDLPTGINRLNNHFQTMSNDVWGKNEHVFCLVIHKLRHGGELVGYKKDEHEESEQATYEHGADRNECNWKGRAGSLMDLLFEELPRQYIHIPSFFDVRVNNIPVQFLYWQRRLVELTKFTVKIDTHNAYTSAEDWKDPASDHVYPIRIYCGFDALRVNDAKAKRAMSLFVYSRRSGRLIKHAVDARGDLGLSAGGTVYSQGLTIVVDDFHGNLPLNPTKQDIAFGEQANGESHKMNLMSWVGAIAHMYYSFHLDKYDGRKTELTEQVKRHANTIEDLHRSIGDSGSRIKLLDESDFTTFRNLIWKKTHLHSIRIMNKNAYEEVPGRDTWIRLEPPAPVPSVTKWKKRSVNNTDDAIPEEIASDAVLSLPPDALQEHPPQKRARRPRTTENNVQSEVGIGSDEEPVDGDDLQSVIAQANKARGSPAMRKARSPGPPRASLSSSASAEIERRELELKQEVAKLGAQLQKEKEQHSYAMSDMREKQEKLLDQLERAGDQRDLMQTEHEQEIKKLERECIGLKRKVELNTIRSRELQHENEKLKKDMGRSHQTTNGDHRSEDVERLMQANRDLKRSLQLAQQRESQERRKADLANNEKVTLEEIVDHLQTRLRARNSDSFANADF